MQSHVMGSKQLEPTTLGALHPFISPCMLILNHTSCYYFTIEEKNNFIRLLMYFNLPKLTNNFKLVYSFGLLSVAISDGF